MRRIREGVRSRQRMRLALPPSSFLLHPGSPPASETRAFEYPALEYRALENPVPSVSATHYPRLAKSSTRRRRETNKRSHPPGKRKDPLTTRSVNLSHQTCCAIHVHEVPRQQGPSVKPACRAHHHTPKLRSRVRYRLRNPPKFKNDTRHYDGYTSSRKPAIAYPN